MFNGEKGRKITAVVLIMLGITALWDIISDYIYLIFEMCGISMDYFYTVINRVPQFAFAILIIWFGLHLIKGKKKQLDAIEDMQNGD